MPSPGISLRALVLSVPLAILLLITGSPHAADSPALGDRLAEATKMGPPLDVRTEWLRGTWGGDLGEFGLIAANFDDGDNDLEWVLAASPTQLSANDRWTVVDHGAGGFEQVQRSGTYADPISSLAAGDLDQDGFDELLVAYDGFIEVWDG
ncbi:MAG: hypothetical protein AAGE94_18385, partial [Acidobacteriota bacterium]